MEALVAWLHYQFKKIWMNLEGIKNINFAVNVIKSIQTLISPSTVMWVDAESKYAMLIDVFVGVEMCMVLSRDEGRWTNGEREESEWEEIECKRI